MPSPARLYIGRLSPDVRQADLEELFKGYGKIVDLRLVRMRAGRQHTRVPQADQA